MDARAARDPRFLKPEHITSERLAKIRQLDSFARARAQTLAQMSLAWVLRDERMTSALIGASRVEQIEQNVAALDVTLTADELAVLDPLGGQVVGARY